MPSLESNAAVSMDRHVWLDFQPDRLAEDVGREVGGRETGQ